MHVAQCQPKIQFHHVKLHAIMIKQRLNTAVIFLLLTAFLVVKWAPSHAHLNLIHDHGDELHQHSVETHAHQPIFGHTAPVDAHHLQIAEAGVVDLMLDQTPASNKKIYPPLTLAAFAYSAPLFEAVGFDLTWDRHFLPRQTHTSPAQPRAPPGFS